MLKECRGTKTILGCEKMKLVEEFSNSNKDTCKVCENKHKRKAYLAKKADPDTVLYNTLVNRPWL